jgi:hypothetical protein
MCRFCFDVFLNLVNLASLLDHSLTHVSFSYCASHRHLAWSDGLFLCFFRRVLNFGETLGSNASRYLGGSTLSIAYQSDVRLLQPSDFTVISVVRNSVWWRKVDYEIPAGLVSPFT